MRFALSSGSRIEAVSGALGLCPQCSSPVIPKGVREGSLVINHWAHRSTSDCDPWSEPETVWHRAWKNRFPKEWQEVTIGPHRADVKVPEKSVVEFQHSSISPEEITEREKFYGNMVWVFDAIDFKTNLLVRDCGEGRVIFTWKTPRLHHLLVRKPLYWDLGDSLLRVTFTSETQPCGGWGVRLSADDFVKSMTKGSDADIDGFYKPSTDFQRVLTNSVMYDNDHIKDLVDRVIVKCVREQKLSCACRTRHVIGKKNCIRPGMKQCYLTDVNNDGQITIKPSMISSDLFPPLPIDTTVGIFERDAGYSTPVYKICTGEEILLPGISDSGVCFKALTAIQIETLCTLGMLHGALSFMDLDFIVCILAPLILNCRSALLIVEAHRREQYHRQYLYIREHFHVPSLVIQSAGYIVSGSPILHIVSHSNLQKSRYFIHQIQPDLIIVENAKRLLGKESNSGSAVFGYCAKFPDTHMIATGSGLENIPLSDVAKLLAFTLKDKSPLPLDPEVAQAWEVGVDLSAAPYALGSFRRDKESVSDALWRRVYNARGVVR